MVIGVVRDPSGLWDLIQPRLHRCLPLADLICLDPTGTYKHIDQVQVQFELEPDHPPDAFFCMLLFVCEHLDHYKRHKTLIDGFVHDPYVQLRSWLIAVISLGTPGPVRPVRRLLERIESDLSDRISAGQGQVVLIDLADGANQDRSQTDRLTSALKWCVTRTAERRSSEFEYRLRSMQQFASTLDFVSYFSIKESYSLFYQDLGLYDDALRQYDELDALLDTLPNSSPGSGTAPGPEKDDDATPDWPALLLSADLSAIPPTSSLYQYSSVMFSRQIRLLFLMDRVDDVLHRTARFLRNLKESDLDMRDRTSQIVLIVLSIAQMTDHVMIVELLSVALAAFVQCGVTHRLVDFDLESVAFLSPSIVNQDDTESDPIDFLKITSAELHAAFQSADLYQQQYMAFAELVRRAFHDAGRQRFALSLSYRLGSLYFRRGQIRRALEICEPSTALISNAWSRCLVSDLMLICQCHYLLHHIQMYIQTALMLFKIQSMQDQVRDRFRNQFIERMKDVDVGMFRYSGSELVQIESLELRRDQPDLHQLCQTDLFIDELFQFQLTVNSLCRVYLDLTNVSITLDCTTGKQGLDLGPVRLHPGTNRFVFENLTLSKSGDYWPISVQIRIHELVLESELNESRQEPVRVRHRSPTATLHLCPIPDPLILGRVHSIRARNQSNYDSMTNVHLSLQSISNSSIVQTDSITVIIDHLSTNVTSVNGQFLLPDCAAHSSVELIFDINSPTDGVLRQDLSLTLTYTVNDVAVSTQAHTSLIFILPLSLTSSMETVLSRTFIQLILQCMTSISVQLHSYTFQPGPFSYEDLNPQITPHLIPTSKTGFSFIFEIFDRTGPDRDIDDPNFLENFVFRGHFHIRYQPIDGVLSDYSFPVNIQSLKLDPVFHIVNSCTSNGILGHPLPYSIRLSRPPQSTVSTPRNMTQQIVYDIVLDENSWRYAGKLHGRVFFQNDMVISGILIPVMCGYLPVPTVKLAEIMDGNLINIDPAQISVQFDTRQVLVLSRGSCAAGLRSLQ